MDIYVSPNGNDQWSGRFPAPNPEKNDGPLASLSEVQKRLRIMKSGRNYHPDVRSVNRVLSEPVTVFLRGGDYFLKAPLVFGPEDSWPITFRPYKKEKPVISGGERITEWKTTTINGRTAWMATLPEVAAGSWYFRQLFVGGRRAERPRLPKKGLFRMQDVPGMTLPAGWGGGGQTEFIARPGDVKPFRNLTDAEIVYLHFWVEERSPISGFDARTNRVTMQRPSCTALVGKWGKELADYYVDNVFEALTGPGECYRAGKEGRFYSLPRKGETPANTPVYAPRILQLLVCLGKPEEKAYIEHLRFEGITFAHADWRHPNSTDGASLIRSEGGASHSRRHGRGNKAAAAQAACDVPGVLVFEGARFCAVENCTIQHAGWYGVEIGDACHGIRLVGNTLRDLGAGGVKINGAAARDPSVAIRQTGHHCITDNVITRAGRVFHSAVGVLCMNAHNVSICHNHIYDLFYSGVSCGWEWGYQENVSRDNLIAFNHIHDIGHKLLSDMGGIYTLGVQPGTVIRNNLIHDVTSAHYGGWCIYPDEGSSHLLIEHNICYDADRQPFHQHYGRENIVRNNIWVFGGESVAIYSRKEPHRGLHWFRNIMVSRGEPIFRSHHAAEDESARIHSDLNLFHATRGTVFFDIKGKRYSLKQWQKLGRDQHSVVADPKFRNLDKRDFKLAKDSPAWKLGFEPIDLSRVGLRPCSKRD